MEDPLLPASGRRDPLSSDGRSRRQCRCCGGRQTVVALYLATLVFSSSSERIAFKVMLDTMSPFRFFLATLVMILYIPLMWSIVLWKWLRTDEISQEMEEFPKCKFALMAMLDVIQVLMVMIAGGVIPAPLTVLLLQGLIPCTMAASRVFLGNRYRWRHCLGALIVIIGIIVNVFPLMLSDGSVGNNSGGAPIFWNCVIYFCCCIPGAASAIYKEHALKSQPMNIYYLNAWVALFQFIISLLLSPIAFYFQEWTVTADSHWSDFKYVPQNFEMGTSCWLMGKNPPLTYTDGHPVPGAAHVHCDIALPLVCFYIFVNVVFNIFVTLVIKHGSATLMYAASTVAVPISYIALQFYQSWASPSSSFSAFSWPCFAGLAVVCVGLITYRSAEEPGATRETDIAAGDTRILHSFPDNGPAA